MRVVADWIARFLRLPDPPELPAADGEVLRFRAARNYFRLRQAGWWVEQLGTLIGIVFGLAVIDRWVPEPLSQWLLPIELLGIGIWLFQMPVTYALLRLDFENRWYLVSDRSLRIREGVFTVKEQTLTFANIQNLSLRQGPLQRLVGTSDLEVHTAGGGKSGEEAKGTTGHHTGRLRGVANGEQLRSLILSRVRSLAKGDSDGPVGRVKTEVGGKVSKTTSEGHPRSTTLEGVAHELLHEVQQLRSHWL